MQIVKLMSENVKRLLAVTIEPGGAALVTVGGLNGAGKSSVLDSIGYALGGEKLVPEEPIRLGESEAKITVDLGDFVVTRTFKRDRLLCNCGAAEAVGKALAEGAIDAVASHNIGCAVTAFGDTRSALTVRNKDGATYPSPQAMLDKMLSRLTFDPLAFANEKDAKKQAETLRQITNLDFKPLDDRRKVLFDERAMVNKGHKAVLAELLAMPETASGTPDEEIGADAVKAELEKAEELRKVAKDAEDTKITISRNIAVVMDDIKDRSRRILGLLEELAVVEAANAKLKEDLEIGLANESAAGLQMHAAKAAVPDVAAINARLQEIAAVNQRVRDRKARTIKEQRLMALGTEAANLSTEIEKLDTQKVDTLANTPFPVPGLGLTDEGVTFEGLPFKQAATSVQLRTSVAIGLALNPSLKVLLVRNGNLLDEHGVRLLGEMAEAAGAQIWMEYVTGKDEGVTVMIEDGKVK